MLQLILFTMDLVWDIARDVHLAKCLAVPSTIGVVFGCFYFEHGMSCSLSSVSRFMLIFLGKLV